MATATRALDSKAGLALRLADARARTDEIFSIVRPEALYDRPIPERHRLVFYLGHLEAFDWNLVCRGAFHREPFHAEFDRLFAFGIDPVDGGLPNEKPSEWPRAEEVLAYNRRVRDTVDGCLRDAPLEDGGDTIFQVAIEHRLMHAETLAYLLQRLPLERKLPQSTATLIQAQSASPRSIDIPAGTATLGLRRKADVFGWDNEFEEHRVEVPAFSIDAYKRSNGEFLKFVREGGYRERNFWSAADWEWITRQRIVHPNFWLFRDNRWWLRTMFDEIPLPLDWPVYVSHAEATAYARWLGKSLPTEAQFHRAAYGTPAGDEREFPWGNEPPSATRGNFDFARWDAAPVTAYPVGGSAFGALDLVGNGWEWTSTLFAPFNGFEPFPFYRGYSADFFDGQHYVMKGGSARTAACMLRRSFRNWFQPHYQHVFAGFRCVEN
jgi:ergothioneine biosynthesis protein EgtB